MRHGPHALAQLQALPLADKVKLTGRRIRQWCDAHDGLVYVAFSGGLDSTVLAHLCEQICPDAPRVFFDTGLEYPENRKFCKQLGAEFVRPDKTFRQVLEQYGYPVVSKRIAYYIYEARNYAPGSATVTLRLTGRKPDGRLCRVGQIPRKWLFLLDAPFKIHARCCHWLKKRPAHQYERRTSRAPMLGVRAAESVQRSLTWRTTGCNAMNGKRPRSWPMAFWTAQDVIDYIAAEGLIYSALYDKGYERSGCMFCAFGVHLEGEPNRFQRMQETHPRQWRYCIEALGMREVLEFIGVPWRAPKLLWPTGTILASEGGG